jgi:protease-4
MSEPLQPPPEQPISPSGSGSGATPTTPPRPGTPPPPLPPRYFYTTPPPAPASSTGTSLLGCGLALSVALNLMALFVFFMICIVSFGRASLPDAEATTPLPHTHYSGKPEAPDKIAIVSLDGVIVEGLLSFMHRQIDQAARDEHVKAVVLRINSPGGSITASDDLHNRLTKLAQGDPVRKTAPKPLIVSMGALAASGGYYVAMPGRTIVAEQTTLTGSIGVFASFPDISGLAEKYQFGMTTIKQGEIKDSGSPFHTMTPKERQVWQDMVDHAYDQFLEVVTTGRKDKLTKPDLLRSITLAPVNAGPADLHKEPVKPYQRYLADGGVWTADKALKYKLIDQIGSLDDAIQVAHDAADLGKSFESFRYERPKTLSELLLGAKSTVPESVLEPGRLSAGLTPRLWYLSPGSELSGILAAAEAK